VTLTGIRTVTTGTTAIRIRIMYMLGHTGAGDGGVAGGIIPTTTDALGTDALAVVFTPIGFSEVVDITTLLAL